MLLVHQGHSVAHACENGKLFSAQALAYLPAKAERKKENPDAGLFEA
jgi:hypothetical protein